MGLLVIICEQFLLEVKEIEDELEYFLSDNCHNRFDMLLPIN